MVDFDRGRAWLAWNDPDLSRGARWAVVLAWLQGEEDMDIVLGTVAAMNGITEADWEQAGHWIGRSSEVP